MSAIRTKVPLKPSTPSEQFVTFMLTQRTIIEIAKKTAG